MPELILSHHLSFKDLYERDGLLRIDALFIEGLQASDSELCHRLLEARTDAIEGREESTLMIELASHLEDFIGDLFHVGDALLDMASRRHELAPVFACKRQFIQKRVKAVSGPSIEETAGEAIRAELEALFGDQFSELVFSRHVLHWLRDREPNFDALNLAAAYAGWAVHTASGRRFHNDGVLFKLPKKTDPMHLIPLETVRDKGVSIMRLPERLRRHRDGFQRTDHTGGPEGIMDQANYCIWCHNQGRDSCSKGLRDRKTGAFRKSPFAVPLAGCPLEEHISEMNLLMADGHALGALAAVTVNNPMLAGTGHRICNDCMKSCIYQRQEPVDIPRIETGMLRDVLSLPWGFEIYSLLTRWNPLNLKRPIPKETSGYKVLVAGLGPAGYTLSHHLMNEGHSVVAIDGLKIEPLPETLSGVTAMGKQVPFLPIRNVQELYESLDERIMSGFGGVAEYGITVRWDKNFLKLIRMLLERRQQFAMYGGVRFGGTLSIDSAFALGFDHIALCMGAGRPTVISIPNNMARGVREASDFLMALQLTGAAKASSIANLQMRMPVVVIGGGLTAIDTATEAMAYYPVQVEKFLSRYETLAGERGEEKVRSGWDEEGTIIADEFIRHARAIRAEREQAAAEGREPQLCKLINSWGGVTIAYRRRMVDSPAYTLNHEEVILSMGEGIRFAELLSPVSVEIDAYGHADGLHVAVREICESEVCELGDIEDSGEVIRLPARSILIAAGTHPNTVLSREEPGQVELDGHYFQAIDLDGNAVHPERSAKPNEVHMLMNIRPDGRTMSFFGDLHPSFAGNVVKAMASARQGFPIVNESLRRRPPTATSMQSLRQRLNEELRPTVHQVAQLTPTIVEIIVHAPMSAYAFRPGQFYRLQNYETFARNIEGTSLSMEGLALTGAWVDREQGLISLIVLQMGGSSSLCKLLKPGEPVVLMGPTGAPTEIASNEKVLLAGGGLGNAVLFSIGQAFRAAGSEVLYFAAYKGILDRYKVEQIEAAADVIVWVCEESPGFQPARPQDRAFTGNIVEAMIAYGSGGLGETEISLIDVDRLICIGSDGMMAAVARARRNELKGILKPGHKAIGSINSPMQCMMKEICGQCLQTHRDPETGKETAIFSCFNQDQSLDHVDFNVLHGRLAQQSTQEKLTSQWIGRCLDRLRPLS